ncbi:hypothetical protein R3P38DRAFT_3337113 [Favolaschia claudopus]|uniref:Ndc10 domain-containing protein n=1 Tax=Favolaschia claudopus TaxID=2862362 RepID=A0AAV9Z2X0_9AGAR
MYQVKIVVHVLTRRVLSRLVAPASAAGSSSATIAVWISSQSVVQQFKDKAKNIKNNYKGYYDRGIKILKDVVAERRSQEKKSPGSLTDGIDTDLLEKAFTGKPNKHSVYALEMYLTQKCVVEDHGKSTADGIHGAMVNYWDRLPGGHYTGEYSLDEDTGKVRGNPGRAPQIVDFVKCVKNKARVKGAAATRNHAEAPTIGDMRQFMDWSQSQCSHEMLDMKPKDTKELLLMITHGMMRAFLSAGFVLWMRNFETCQIQERDLSDGKGPAPYYLPYLGVFLDNRKGWQQKQGYDGPLESNHYQIYEQKDTPEIDMYSHPDDYLFPFVSSNGIIHAKRPMTHDRAQELINEFALGAKINKIFTTHCLRRGGAQYRFMFAPMGQRWSLSIIRWWGGWAVGEQVDTLMRYLLDSLHSYEIGHGDALYPFRNQPDKSFMAEHNELQPPTTEFRLFGNQILTKLDGIVSQLMELAVLLLHRTSVSSHDSATPSSRVNHSSSHASATSISESETRLPQPTLSASDPRSDEENSSPPATPISGALIPAVGRDASAWKRAIDPWYRGNPSQGLQVALKNWPVSWYTGSMRLKTGTLYSNRKILAEAYERCVVFLPPYPTGLCLLYWTLFS